MFTGAHFMLRKPFTAEAAGVNTAFAQTPPNAEQ
jgi:hypothetical protein